MLSGVERLTSEWDIDTVNDIERMSTGGNLTT